MTRQQGSKWLAESNAQASRLPTAWRCCHVHLLVEEEAAAAAARRSAIIVCLTCVPLFICINMDDDTTLTVTFYLAPAE